MDSGFWFNWLNLQVEPKMFFAYSNAGDGLVILSPEKTDRIVFESLAQGGGPGNNGELIIEYVNAVDNEHRITGWKQLQIIEDTTKKLK